MNSTTYVVSVKLWYVPLSADGDGDGDGDVFLTICDNNDCYGYFVIDQGGYSPAQSKSFDNSCESIGGETASWSGMFLSNCMIFVSNCPHLIRSQCFGVEHQSMEGIIHTTQ